MAAIPTTQRAATVVAYEGPAKMADNIRLVADKPVPSPGPGQVLVQMRLRPVNPADGFSAMGLYPGFAPASALPATLGLEGMGAVAAVGEGVTAFKPGDRVVPLFCLGACTAGEGSWQQYVAMPADHVVPIPDALSDDVAAQLVINPATVFGMLAQLAVPAGAYLLQTQATSTLGRMMIQMAKAKGVRTINVVRRRAAFDELKALGADECICSTDEDVVARVTEITGGQMAYGAIDSVAGELTGQVIASLRPGGTVLIFGGASGLNFTASIVDPLFRDVTIKGFWVNTFLQQRLPEERHALFTELIGLLTSGVLEPFLGETFDLADFGEALKKQTAEGRGGKILLRG
eukprot:TRINITY_DN31878_c0_g1_i1.p1 TRINITY_DN31878_c0_g1~~TRINITY_DN31878_c0_g1_i1.p1  ORF type:complete len:372 (+),score=14.01 TRINITY_DN31878_c0_g1_i1:77-1117(+)